VSSEKKEPVAKRQFCNFNGADRLRRNKDGRSEKAGGEMEGGEMEGADVNEGLRVHQKNRPLDLHPSAAPSLDMVAMLETESVPFVAKAHVPSIFGKFSVYGFSEKQTGKEHLAIVSGEIDARKRVNVRIHCE
jgi:hypothetical protein